MTSAGTLAAAWRRQEPLASEDGAHGAAGAAAAQLQKLATKSENLDPGWGHGPGGPAPAKGHQRHPQIAYSPKRQTAFV